MSVYIKPSSVLLVHNSLVFSLCVCFECIYSHKHIVLICIHTNVHTHAHTHTHTDSVVLTVWPAKCVFVVKEILKTEQDYVNALEDILKVELPW